MNKKLKKNQTQTKLLFANSYVGFEITKYLLHNFFEDICGIVTTSKNNIYNLAYKANKKVFIYKDNVDFLKKLPQNIDLGLLIWWPFIIKKPLLDIPKNGFLNTHPSFLPYNKGKNPNFWAIVENNPFGVTIHKIDRGIDTGPIISQKEIHYDWRDTGESLYKKSLIEMIKLFKRIYPRIRLQILNSIAQKKISSFHFKKDMDLISKIDLDKKYRAKELFNLLRARTFNSYPSCFFEDNGKKYEVRIKITKKLNKL